MAAKKDSVTARILCEVLVEGVKYKPDAVVALPSPLFQQLKAFGSVDESKASIDYCLSIGAVKVEHKAN
jgi:hypothetical protein